MEVPKDLKNEIWNFCRENDITDINNFMLEMLKRGFNIEKYGEKPSIFKDSSEEDNKKEHNHQGRELTEEELEQEKEKTKQLEKELADLKEKVDKQMEEEKQNNENKEQKETNESDKNEEGKPKRDIYGDSVGYGSNLLD